MIFFFLYIFTYICRKQHTLHPLYIQYTMTRNVKVLFSKGFEVHAENISLYHQFHPRLTPQESISIFPPEPASFPPHWWIYRGVHISYLVPELNTFLCVHYLGLMDFSLRVDIFCLKNIQRMFVGL